MTAAKGGWTEVRVAVPVGWQELVGEVLAEGGWTSVVIGRPSLGAEEPPEGREYVRSFLPAGEDGSEARAAVARRLRELVERVGDPELSSLEPAFHVLPPEDYARSWRKTWRPFRVGRLCVVPPERREPLRADDVALLLEPGAAFGTGRHCTTRACLALLQERLAPGSRVLDAGSGSGILAVAAALLGASEAFGFDVDPRAPGQGRELAEQNGVAERCTFRGGGFEVLGADDAEYDAVLANLYSDVIQAHAADLAARLRSGGWFAFSGCPGRHRAPTEERIAAAGLQIEEVRRRGRWLTFTGTRRRRRALGHAG